MENLYYIKESPSQRLFHLIYNSKIIWTYDDRKDAEIMRDRINNTIKSLKK